ncbi:phage portal protein [Nitrospirillum sp. BR 11163]|uniref:phage portal protein n=1 Tax=Nitrospirillum sp. BR 11163 TaxID=3104323 RepID=UPI002AFECF17|nr:phage portal protein [Nitrospirillum sp. BR 11163]MEA1674090.1 phage portal protein [Nitrospirillum sp. BR 11163]
MKPIIINPDGTPMQRLPARSAAQAATAYQAADRFSQELAGWVASMGSPDANYLPERDEIVSRVRDIARNSGWASSAIRREMDNVIGAGFRLSYKPHYRALGVDPKWAFDFANYIEGRFHLYANDPGFYADASRHTALGMLFGQAYRQYCVDGDAFAAVRWLPDRGGLYATALQVIHSDRVSSPNNLMDQDTIRGGVEIDPDTGAALAYHIRRRHPWDIPGPGMADAYTWDRHPRETPWGRPMTIHFFDVEEPGQTRGVSRLAPVLERLKMVDKYDKVELQAAVLNAIMVAVLESPFDHDLLQEAMDDSSKLRGYQDARKEFHDQRQIKLGGVRIPTLFPGEKLTFSAAARPNPAFNAFETAALRNIAAGTGQSYEQLAGDWSQVNYSSARAALLEVWKTFSTRRAAFATGFCTPLFGAWLEEEFARGEFDLPRGAPGFHEARAAWVSCRWIGPGRGWVDPVKERQGAILGMAAGLSSLEQEAAEQGLDWQEVAHQRARERAFYEELNLPQPSWADVATMTSGGAAAPAKVEE